MARPSWTAELVAVARALAHGTTAVAGFDDPVAERLLGPAARRLLGVARRFARPIDDYVPLSVITLRVVYIDRLVERAVHEGVRQVVILGAGFDTRAFRMDALAGSKVFEVDQPGTQAVKRARASTQVPKATLTYVPVDFARDALDERLADAGHDPAAPTLWIWEGVVMYLRDEALRSTLRAVRAGSSPGSTLVLHYHAPDPPGWVTQGRHALFWLLGEPHVGLRDPATMAAELSGAGFTLREDVDGAAQAEALRAPFQLGPRERTSRIAVATVIP